MQKPRISIITIRSAGNCLKGSSQQALLKGNYQVGGNLLFDRLTLGPIYLIVSLVTLAQKVVANERYLLMT